MNETVQSILDTVQVGAMATVNRDRTPAVAPLHFARMGDRIVWISNRTTRHAENAIRSGKVEFVVWNDKKQAVYLHTTALVASDRDEELALEAYAKKFGDFKPKGDLVEVYISPIGQLDENSTTQNMWHFVA
jgi:general stress protein 26